MHDINKTVLKCIHCGKCTKNCNFLSKYSINLFDFASRKDLKNSCFLCNKCQSMCPKSISGKEVALFHRREDPVKSFKNIIKKNYIFKSFPKKSSSTPITLYLGCNYPGIYPKTVKKLISICKKFGIDYIIDCCKKPLLENGINYNFYELENKFISSGIKTLICTCPNCFHLFKKQFKKIDIKNVYEFLYEHKIGHKINEEANIFFPCSDRYSLAIFKSIEPFLTIYKTDTFKDINCCGLGGGAIEHEPALTFRLLTDIKNSSPENIYTYCSSCSGIFSKYGLDNIKNILSEILQVNELPSRKYINNVISYKLKRR